MADSRIQDLPAIDALADGDLFPVAREGDSYNARKVTAGQMTDYIEGVAQPYLTGAQEAANQAAMSAASAAVEVGKIGTAVEDTKAAQAAAETARDEAVAAGAGIDEKVTRAETAAQTATEKAGQAATAESNAALSAGSAESAKQAAETAKQAAESAQGAAEAASGTATSSAAQAVQSAQNAQQSEQAAQTAKEGAEAAQEAIENLGVDANTLESGSPATVQKTVENGVVKLTFGLPSGDKGDKGDTGASMSSIERVSGTGAPGTFDTYNVVLTDGQVVGQFQVYNGADGQGAGDMLKAVYDPQNKNTDIFSYVDQAVQDIPVPDVSAQIAQHNADVSAHPDIRAELAGKEQAGAAAAVQSNLDTHTADKNNPHGTTAEQVGARPNTWTPTAEEVGADEKGSAEQALNDAKSYTDQKISEIPTPDVSAQIAEHNASPESHPDIRASISTVQTGLNGHITNKQNPHGVTAEQAGARPDTWTPTAQEVGADPAGSAAQALADSKSYTDQKISSMPSGGGKRVARYTVGTSTAGWTAADCDYLCDGTADQEEINAAIQALPPDGGEIVILDGTYNIAGSININKNNVKISGNGVSTKLFRQFDAKTGIIVISTESCIVDSIYLNGRSCDWPGILVNGPFNQIRNCNFYNHNYSIQVKSDNNIINSNTVNTDAHDCIYVYGNNNIILENTCMNSSYGIKLYHGDFNSVVGNFCGTNRTCGISIDNGENNSISGNVSRSNGEYGASLYQAKGCVISGNTFNKNAIGIRVVGSDANTISGNACNNNNTGIMFASSDNNIVVGNIFIRGTGISSDYTSSQNTIHFQSGNYNLISSNSIMGKNYVSEGGTGNEFINNKYQ